MLSDGPPSFDAVTTSRTWPELTRGEHLDQFRNIAAGQRLPHEMIAERFHHRPSGSADSSGTPGRIDGAPADQEV